MTLLALALVLLALIDSAYSLTWIVKIAFSMIVYNLGMFLAFLFLAWFLLSQI